MRTKLQAYGIAGRNNRWDRDSIDEMHLIDRSPKDCDFHRETHFTANGLIGQY